MVKVVIGDGIDMSLIDSKPEHIPAPPKPAGRSNNDHEAYCELQAILTDMRGENPVWGNYAWRLEKWEIQSRFYKVTSRIIELVNSLDWTSRTIGRPAVSFRTTKAGKTVFLYDGSEFGVHEIEFLTTRILNGLEDRKIVADHDRRIQESIAKKLTREERIVLAMDVPTILAKLSDEEREYLERRQK